MKSQLGAVLLLFWATNLPDLCEADENTTSLITTAEIVALATSPPTESPTVSSPDASVFTPPPTLSPTVAPSDVPSDLPTNGAVSTDPPTGTNAAPPPALAVEDHQSLVLLPVSPINLTDANPDAVTERCLEILDSVGSDAAALTTYWAPPASQSTTKNHIPLYYSLPEGDVTASASLTDFTPAQFLGNVTARLVRTMSSATNTTPIDIAGTTCSMNLDIVVVDVNDDENDADCSVPMVSRSFMELDSKGRLVSWMNAFDSATFAQACSGGGEATSETTAAACTAAFESLFPPFTPLTMGTLMASATGLFVPNVSTFAFPAGNPKTTLSKFGTGWSLYSWFMDHLNPFEMSTTVSITSPVTVAGSVCSADQEITVHLVKAAAASATCATPLVVAGRVVWEVVATAPTTATTGVAAPPPRLVRLLSQFDNTTFWGEIERCVALEKQAKQEKKAQAKAEKAAAKKEKQEKKQAEKAKKAQAKKEKEEKKAAAKKEKEAEKAKKAQAKKEKKEKKAAAKKEKEAAKQKEKEEKEKKKQAKKLAKQQAKAKKKQEKRDKKAKKDKKDKDSEDEDDDDEEEEDEETNALMWIGSGIAERLRNNNRLGGSPTALVLAFALLIAALATLVRSEAMQQRRRRFGYQVVPEVDEAETTTAAIQV